MNYSEACGGPNRLSVYTSTGSVTALSIPTVQTTGLPGNWQYSQCFAYVYMQVLSAELNGIRSSVNLQVDGYSRYT